jgi:hypothetical protein
LFIGVLGKSFHDIHIGLLQNVGRVDATVEPPIQSQLNRVSQSIAVGFKQDAQGLGVSAPHASDQKFKLLGTFIAKACHAAVP